MSKKKWLFVIILVVFIGYLVISKVNPTWGLGIDNVMGGFIGNVKTGIESTPMWQQYDVWFTFAFGCIITGLVMWKGHGIYNAAARKISSKHVSEVTGYQQTPVSQPVILAAPQQVATPQPVIVQSPPQPQQQNPPKQEPEAQT